MELTMLFTTLLSASFTIPQIVAIAVLSLIVIGAIVAFRFNTKIQMKVSFNMDAESETYNREGLKIFADDNSKVLQRPIVAIVQIDNLMAVYKSHPKKKDLIMNIANVILKGMKKEETVARVEFNKFAVLYNGRELDEVKGLCKAIEEKINDEGFDKYSDMKFEFNFGINEHPDLNGMYQSTKCAEYSIKYSPIKDKNIYVYCDDVAQSVNKEERMNNAKKIALEQKQFVPYIIPRVSLKTGKVIGGEITCRWVDEQQNELYQFDDFYNLFEENGFITQIDEEMFKNACQLAQQLVRKDANTVISVNISKKNFDDPEFVNRIEQVAKDNSVQPKNIALTISDMSSSDGFGLVATKILELRQKGFRVEMNGFGKSQASLSSLANMSLDSVKIDGSFFKNGLTTEKAQNMAIDVINMLKRLNVSIVCGGVSNKDTMNFVAGIDLDVVVQGDVVSKAIPLYQFEPFTHTTFSIQPVVIQQDVRTYSKVTAPKAASVPSEDNQKDPRVEELNKQIQQLQQDLKSQLEASKKKEEEDAKKAHQEELDKMRQEIEALKNAKKEGSETLDMNKLIAAIQAAQQANVIDELDDVEEDEEPSRKKDEANDEELAEDLDMLDDDDEDTKSPEGYAPKYGLVEAKSIIQAYKNAYDDNWMPKCREDLKENFDELVKSIQYHGGQLKLTFKDKFYIASNDVKHNYSEVKNMLMKYQGVENKTLNACDSFYIGHKQIAKITFTKTKVRLYLALNPENYSANQFPHKNVSAMKAHAKTPFMTNVKSNLSLKRASKLISDVMLEEKVKVNPSYKPVDYATK